MDLIYKDAYILTCSLWATNVAIFSIIACLFMLYPPISLNPERQENMKNFIPTTVIHIFLPFYHELLKSH